MTDADHLGPGERYQEAGGGRIYIQGSETGETGNRIRTRLYDDGTIQADAFGVDEPGIKHSHAIDQARMGEGATHWEPVYRRAAGGAVSFDRDAALKRDILLEDARALHAEGRLTSADAERLQARWRNIGRGQDADAALLQDRELRDLLRGIRSDRGR